jgi:peroxiredoxin
MASPVYRDLMTPKLRVGEPAYEFELPRLDGGGTVALADFAGRQPVALVFGSYT